MSLTLKHTYTFDSFVLDVEEQVLLRDGRMVPLTPKVFETLLLLVQNQGSVVSKQTILNTIWPDVFVEESNITFNITKLRKALGDNKKPPIYIETVPRRGYRFKTEVREIVGESLANGSNNNGHDLASALPVAPELKTISSTEELDSTSTSRWFEGKRTLLILSVLGLVAFAALTGW